MDRKKKKPERMLPVSLVLTKEPVLPAPLARGNTKAGLSRPRSGNLTSARASASAAPVKPHPPPPHRLPASYFKRANPAIKLVDASTPAAVEEEMDVEDQESQDLDEEENNVEGGEHEMYLPHDDEDDDEDDENSFDHDDTMSEDDLLGSRKNNEVEQEALDISSGEDKVSEKANKKQKKGPKQCIENSKCWQHFEKVKVHTKEDPKGPKVLRAKCIHVRNELFTLFEKFDNEKKQSEKCVPSKSHMSNSSMPASDGKFQSWRSNTTPKSSKSELRNYLDDDGEDNEPQFDLLNWWKVNSLRYPVLAMMARRFLTIPASSVSSESTFSTGGRVLDDYRSSLKPVMVEALVCGASYIKGAHSDLNVIERDMNDAEEDMETIVLPKSVVESN